MGRVSADVFDLVQIRAVALRLHVVAMNEAQRQEILGCRELDRLDRWFRRAVLASSDDDALDLPAGPTGRETPAQG